MTTYTSLTNLVTCNKSERHEVKSTSPKNMTASRKSTWSARPHVHKTSDLRTVYAKVCHCRVHAILKQPIPPLTKKSCSIEISTIQLGILLLSRRHENDFDIIRMLLIPLYHRSEHANFGMNWGLANFPSRRYDERRPTITTSPPLLQNISPNSKGKHSLLSGKEEKKVSTKSEKASFQLPLIRERQRANSILPIRCNLAKMAQESDFLAER